MLSKTSTQIVAIILLAGFLPGAKANCYIDNNGYETCDGLSNLARALIGVAFFLAFLGILFSMFAYRRRRNRRANLAYIQQVQPGTGGVYNGAGGPPPFTPQYPPPAHNGLNYPYNYDPSSGFAPPSGAPPQYYAHHLARPRSHRPSEKCCKSVF
ncbi:hypothetical protein BGY98DRAFT_38741 [Russula aff. rugulosa BPL654]|nr:hypothetical protein BGY98DRAFT_38741 [Russula aff. rugulosa BPL654]